MIHEVHGLNEDIRKISRRFADAGYAALAVDMFTGRNRAICMTRYMAGMLMGSVNRYVVCVRFKGTPGKPPLIAKDQIAIFFSGSVNQLIDAGTVHDATDMAFVKLTPSFAIASSVGVMSRPYPREPTCAAWSASKLTNTTL